MVEEYCAIGEIQEIFGNLPLRRALYHYAASYFKVELWLRQQGRRAHVPVHLAWIDD
jgi:hypothetical protein